MRQGSSSQVPALVGTGMSATCRDSPPRQDSTAMGPRATPSARLEPERDGQRSGRQDEEGRTGWGTGQDAMQRAGQNRAGQDGMGRGDMPLPMPSHWQFPFSNNRAVLNDLDTSTNVLN